LAEVLVVIALTCVLIALLIPAVLAVRGAAARAQSANNMKNIVLGVHAYASSRGGQLPSFNPRTAAYEEHPSVYALILPNLEQNRAVFVSPLDPTRSIAVDQEYSSYALNATVFFGWPKMAVTFPDGMSNTIALTEHYAECDGTRFMIFATSIAFRRATFADKVDARPITQGNPPVSSSSCAAEPLLTFQVTPALAECDDRFPQALQPSGMLVALADGSVRTLSPGVSPSTYWALVTPSGGEAIGDW
jgi:hypothetical protein